MIQKAVEQEMLREMIDNSHLPQQPFQGSFIFSPEEIQNFSTDQLLKKPMQLEHKPGEQS
jgi:hypothetical protein